MSAINVIQKRTGKGCCFILFISGLLGVSGCQQTPPVETTSSSEMATATVPSPVISSQKPATLTTSVPKDEMASDAGTVSNCQHELLALSKINQRLYAQKKSAFDELLSSASVYTSVRDDITGQTRETVDAFYKYKTQKLCSDIEQSVRQALINRMESFK